MDTSGSGEAARSRWPALVFTLVSGLLDVLRKPTVFISYRRRDTARYAELIHERLVAELGRGNVFFDRDDIDYGKDFARIIEARVRTCQVLLVLVGPDWLTPPDDQGVRRPRLEDADDYVRHEIESGLRRGTACRVIPVCVHGAKMPAAADLPAALAGFAALNACEIDDAASAEGVEKLVSSIVGTGVPLSEFSRTLRFQRSVMPLVVCAVLAALSAGWVNLLDVAAIDVRFTDVITRLADSHAERQPDERVVLVAITAASERRLDKKDFDASWRHEHARLIRTLAERGAAAVVFDVYLKARSAYDGELVAAVQEARRRGMAVVFGSESARDDLLGTAVTGLEAAGADIGLLCIGKPKTFASITLAMLAVARTVEGRPSYLPSIGLLALGPAARVRKIEFGERRIELDTAAGELRTVHFSTDELVTPQLKPGCGLKTGDRTAQSIVRLSPLEVLRSPPKRLDYADLVAPIGDRPAPIAAGRIFLVGRESDGDRRWVSFGLHQEERYGFEIHADILHMLVAQEHVRPLAFGWQMLIALTLAYQGQRVVRLAAFGRRAVRWLALSAAVAGYFVIAVHLYAEYGILLELYPLIAFILAHALLVHSARKLGLWKGRRR